MSANSKPLNIGEAFGRAMAAWDDGNAAEARRLARSIVESKPDFGGAHYLLGLIALAQGQARRAAEHLTQAVAADPNQSVPRLALGRALEALDNYNSAILHYRAILSREPDHAEANARLAELLGRLGRNKAEALEHARRAVKVAPRHPEALCTLGTLLHQTGDHAEAARMLERSLEIRPDWAVALNNYGLVLGSLGQYERAVAVLSGAAELRRDHAGTRANLAAALRGMGRLDEARLHAERATKINSRDMAGWLELGLVRKALGMPEAAAAAFERAVTAAPDSVHAHYCLAEARLVLGEKNRAAKSFRRCLELDPEDRHGAALGLAQAGAGEAPARAPDAYVRQLFDDYADKFDAALVDKLAYRAPALLAQAMDKALDRRQDLDVLDAGCGTGLAAPVLRPLAARLDGIDLSGAMVDKARARGLYDGLEVGELVAGLRHHPHAYDLVVAADVLVYFGGLEDIMAATALALKPGGVFAFTVERADDCASYVLGAKNRYAHAPEYVDAVAAANGFSVVSAERASTRQEAGEDVPGLVVVLRKG
ncbi:tetratricopeptide repeat protein [Paramagnetospirillum magneticum]|uniref:Predicted methyltransferase n=1 Tax=Paramagnetospirillum magneticum (strain ATCC 700264 / AMB-1) TaxID=342108 RepID=Q2W002_PARM1|nr:tetratricopeptide repeat protein [Paramagnetospirillum magneticum]BAE52823.1 Predicted methyltransferase [Paramagnetospirillum magneticum AMB-1]